MLRQGEVPTPLDHLRMVTTWDALADLLSTESRRLRYFAHVIRTAHLYRTFSIPKRNGALRSIAAPIPELASIQRKIGNILASGYSPPLSVHGFITAKDFISAARPHIGSQAILNVDIQDFFPSIHFGRIAGRLKKTPFLLPIWIANALASICTLNGVLPQGAPSSPLLSNIICGTLDRDLSHLARRMNWRYSRYVDDITFSTRSPRLHGFHSPTKIEEYFNEDDSIFHRPVSTKIDAKYPPLVFEMVDRCVSQNGFCLNPAKSKMMMYFNRQEVTGIVVNRKLSVRRQFIRRIRAMVHAWQKFGLERASIEHFGTWRNERHPPEDHMGLYKRRLIGMADHVRHVNGEGSSSFQTIAATVRRVIPHYRNMETIIVQPSSQSSSYDVFICHAHEDKSSIATPIVDACDRIGVKVWIDHKSIGWGDSVVGSIQAGLSHARFVLVILSPNSVGKAWPMKELNTALSLEISKTPQLKVLPLLVGSQVEIEAILKKLPLVADKLYLEWKSEPDWIASELNKLISA